MDYRNRVDYARRDALQSNEYKRLLADMKKGNSFPLRSTRKRPSLEKPETPWHCAYCGAQFRSIDGVLEIEKVVTCIKCNRKFCKEKCSKRTSTHADSDESGPLRWICKKCQPDSWLSGIIRLLHINNSNEWYAKKMTAEQAQIKVELAEMQRKEREQVRDFIERLVEALLGGELDHVSVKKIYNDEHYDAICSRYHGDLSAALTDLGSALHITISNLPIAGESPCSAHASLKNLIQRFIREATELPKLRRVDDDPIIQDATIDRTYEDLLSTAIINKVVQNYQERAPSVVSESGSTYKKSHKRANKDKEYFLGERNLDRFTDDTSSVSSIDEYISANGSTKYFDKMNFAIQQSIKEVSSSDEDDPENYDLDDIDSPLHKRNKEWKENWYLRKRDFASGANSPVPVPMLVPNPSDHAKVLIGDREADDTTDLSDAASDYEDSAEPSSLNAVLVNSRSVIGGRNPIESLVAKAESISNGDLDPVKVNGTQTQVQVHQTNEPDTSKDDIKEIEHDSLEFISDDVDNSSIIETCNEAFFKHDTEDTGATADVEDQSLLSFASLESNTEKDSEYTEKYATLPRKIPMPTPRQSKLSLSEIDFTNGYLIEDSKTENGDSGVTSDEDEKTKSFRGSAYGEREKEKWNHAVEIANNPYSKMNLESRLSNRSSSISSLNSPSTSIQSHTSTQIENDNAQCELEHSEPEQTTPENKKLNEIKMSKSLFDIFNEDRKGQNHRFGRDYFAKQAAKPQGSIKKDSDDDEDSKSPSLSPAPVDDPIVPEDTSVFRAVPAIIHAAEDVDDQAEAETSLESSTPMKRGGPWDFSSDSDYSIERTYNINSGKIIKKVGDLEYEAKQFDENQNSLKKRSTHLQRSRFLRSLTHDDDNDEGDGLMMPPAVNHFKLVDEIANESSEQYQVVPISPPAEYRTKPKLETCRDDSIEYETNEKSYEFTIDDVFDEEDKEQERKLQELNKNQENLKRQEECDKGIIYEHSLPSQLLCVDDLDKIEDITNVNETETNVVEDSDEEIDMLKEKQLVKQVLSAFSKSFPNLNALPLTVTKPELNRHKTQENINYSSEINENDIEIEDAIDGESEARLGSIPSVNNLKKMFEKESDIKTEVHSLTARSLPKHVRQELAAQAQTTRMVPQTNEIEEVRINVQEDELELQENKIEEPEEPAFTEFPTAKSRIAYFEQMSNK